MARCHNCQYRLTYLVSGYCPLTDHNGSYEDLFEFGSGAEILTKVDIGEYQGSSVALVFKDDKYALLNWGWGSCSGCDALQAAHDDENDLCDLFHLLYDSLMWRSREEMIEYVQQKEWKIEWYYSEDSEAIIQFVDDALRELESRRLGRP